MKCPYCQTIITSSAYCISCNTPVATYVIRRMLEDKNTVHKVNDLSFQMLQQYSNFIKEQIILPRNSNI